MFPGQFGNANKCLRLNSLGNYLTSTEIVMTNGVNAGKKYLLITSTSFGSTSLTWGKGIGQIEALLVGGGGAGGTSTVQNYAGRGGDGAAVVSTNATFSISNTNQIHNITIGQGGANQPASAGTATQWLYESTTVNAGGGGAGQNNTGLTDPRGGDSMLNSATQPTGADGSLLNFTSNDTTVFTYYGSGGGGGSTTRKTSGTYTNLGGGLGNGGFGMQYPIGGSLYTASGGSRGGGGGGGGYFSAANGGGFYYGNTGGNGFIAFKTLY